MNEPCAFPRPAPHPVIPSIAGIHPARQAQPPVDSRLRGNDEDRGYRIEIETE